MAIFSVTVPFLPENPYVNEFEGYRLPGYKEYEENAEKYTDYISKITRRLENLPKSEFEPNLTHFEELISSLKIEE